MELLILSGLNQPEEFKVARTKDEVHVSHFSYFDRDTGETLNMELSFTPDEYDRGLEELKRTGKTLIRGKFGDLELNGLLGITFCRKRQTSEAPPASYSETIQTPRVHYRIQ